jgi:hypothetical protein
VLCLFRAFSIGGCWFPSNANSLPLARVVSAAIGYVEDDTMRFILGYLDQF